MSPKARKAEGVAIVAFVISVVCAGLLAVLALFNASAANLVLTGPASAAVLVWFFVWIHLRMRRAAWEEQRDIEELRQKRKDSTIFEGQGQAEMLSANLRLKQFEKYLGPFFSFFLAAAFTCFAYFAWMRLLAVAEPAPVLNQLPSMAFLTGVAFACFLIGRYATGMSKEPEWRLLRVGGSFSLGVATGALLVIAGLAASHFGAPVLERLAGYLIPALMAAVGLDIVINQVLDFYRPRIEGQEWRPAYDSRLLGLLSAPGSILKTVADTLDYQFGFSVSETWFYRFMEKAIAPIFLFQIATFYLLTCFVVVGSEEQAIIERFGHPRPGILGPGLYLKLPWPVDAARQEKTQRVREITLGGAHHEEEETHARPGEMIKTMLWTVSHFQEEYKFIMASSRAGEDKTKEEAKEEESRTVPVNMVSGQVTVHYIVRDLYDYIYMHRTPEKVIEQFAYRELVRFLAGEQLLVLLGEGRETAGKKLQALIQERCTENRLGVEIVFVGLQDLHPPIKLSNEPMAPGPEETGTIGQAFEEVVAAEEQKHAKELEAQAYRERTVTVAGGQARKIIEESESYATRRHALAAADAEAFGNQLKAYLVSPEVYRSRKLLETVESAFPEARKYFYPSDFVSREVAIFDWEEKLKTELLDIDLAKETPK